MRALHSDEETDMNQPLNKRTGKPSGEKKSKSKSADKGAPVAGTGKPKAKKGQQAPGSHDRRIPYKQRASVGSSAVIHLPCRPMQCGRQLFLISKQQKKENGT